MGNGEDFLLKWNDHHSLFFAGAEELCQSEEYTDVTLAAGQQFFSAHKLVLSICSPFFRALFKRLGAHKSVIFLKDVEPKHLELLLEYMYKGEIKVQETELVNVLNAAQSLEIKGLTDSSSSGGGGNSQKNDSHSGQHKPDPSRHKRPSPSPHAVDPPVRKRPKIPVESVAVTAPAPAIPPSPVVNVKEEHEVIPVPSEEDGEDWVEGGDGGGARSGGIAGYSEEQGEYSSTVATGYEEMGYEGEEYYSEEGMVNMGEGDDRGLSNGVGHDVDVGRVKAGRRQRRGGGGGKCVCTVCGKATRDQYNLKRHMATHYGGKPYICPICDPVKSYFDAANLRAHMKSRHPEVSAMDVSAMNLEANLFNTEVDQ